MPLQLPYMRLVSLICKATTSHPMVLFEFRNVSLRLCLRGSPVDSAAHAVAAVLQKHNFSEACFVSHSFGTFVSSRVCQMYKSMVQSLVRSQFACRQIRLRAMSESLEAASQATGLPRAQGVYYEVLSAHTQASLV